MLTVRGQLHHQNHFFSSRLTDLQFLPMFSSSTNILMIPAYLIAKRPPWVRSGSCASDNEERISHFRKERWIRKVVQKYLWGEFQIAISKDTLKTNKQPSITNYILISLLFNLRNSLIKYNYIWKWGKQDCQESTQLLHNCILCIEDLNTGLSDSKFPNSAALFCLLVKQDPKPQCPVSPFVV